MTLFCLGEKDGRTIRDWPDKSDFSGLLAGLELAQRGHPRYALNLEDKGQHRLRPAHPEMSIEGLWEVLFEKSPLCLSSALFHSLFGICLGITDDACKI